MAGASVGIRRSVSESRLTALQPFQPKNHLEREWYNAHRKAYNLDRERRYAEAAEAAEAALPLAREAGCASCELRTLANLGGERISAGQHREAFETLTKARRLAERLGDRPMYGVLSLNLSNLYLHRYAIAEAIDAANEAVAALNGLEKNYHWLVNKVLLHKGRLAARQGSIQAAMRTFGQVIAAAEAAGDNATLGLAWEQVGLERLRRGELGRADEALTRSFRIRKLSGDAEIAASYHDLALLRLAQGDGASALHLAEQSIESWSQRPAVRPLWALRLAKGRALAKLQRGLEALEELDAALELVRAARVEVLPADSFRISYGAGAYEAYAARIETGIQSGIARKDAKLIERSFLLAEEARSQSLRISRTLPPEYHQALDRLQAAQAELIRTGGVEARGTVRAARRRLAELEAESDGAAAAAIAPVWRPGLLGDGQALFSFYLGETKSYLFTGTRKNLDVHELPARAEIRNAITRFTNSIRDAAPDSAEQGERLYATLFGQSGAVENKPQWLFSLDREMFDLPFAALVVARAGNRPVYAAERHSIELVPGLWALAQPAREQRYGKFLGLGDPIYNAADSRLEKPLTSVDAAVQLPRLAGSGREIRVCGRFFQESAVLEGEQASWERLREEIARLRPGVLHLAAHFFASPEDRRQVVLALGLDTQGRARYAGAEQIAALRLDGSLVVMSGCGSGDGPAVAGEGRIGLARAWLQAGARSVLATYWPAADDDGRLLESFYSSSFHKASNGGPTNSYLRPGDALQKAQVEMIRSGSWKAEPKYWASYFVITKN